MIPFGPMCVCVNTNLQADKEDPFELCMCVQYIALAPWAALGGPKIMFISTLPIKCLRNGSYYCMQTSITFAGGVKPWN